MTKYILATTLLLLSSFTYASCGPQVELYGESSNDRFNAHEHGLDDHYRSDDNGRSTTFGLSLSFSLGDDRCEEIAKAEELGLRWANEEAQLNVLREKFEFCSSLPNSGLPQSVVTYCGDLLN